MRCAYQHVQHRGVVGEKPCRNHAQHGHLFCHRHLLEERQAIEKAYPTIWVASPDYSYEGYGPPKLVFLTEEEADTWWDSLGKREQRDWDLTEVSWRGEEPDEQ